MPRRPRFRARRRSTARSTLVLIVVQNLPVPLDRRVWMECRALVAAGYGVAVICPKGPGDPDHEVLDGVDLYKYAPPPATAGALSFVYEFAYCWIRTALLSIRVLRRHGIDVLQTCNPPDTYFLLALIHRLHGTLFVFDQHDLCPEMFQSRFGRSSGPLIWGLRTLERATYALADHVITTNESYAEIVQTRGHKTSEEVTVVRSGPDAAAMRPGEPVPELRRGRAHLVCWLGIMGPQDGVDFALRAAAHYVHQLERDDCHFAFLGFGDALADLRELAAQLRLDAHVEFTGRVGPQDIGRYLSTADVGLVPDPKSSYADLSTHNKTLEYMAFAVPVLTTDLKETRFSAGDAAAAVPHDDVDGFATTLADLLDDPARRAAMGRAGRRRIEDALAWEHQEPKYVRVFDRLTAGGAKRRSPGSAPGFSPGR